MTKVGAPTPGVIKKTAPRGFSVWERGVCPLRPIQPLIFFRGGESRICGRRGRKGRRHRGAEERTSGGICAGGRWEAQSPRCPESAQIDAQRRLFEGCAGAWRGRHCQRHPELSLIGIRDDGQGEPPWCRPATPPPCRPPRKPRLALVPDVLNRRTSQGDRGYESFPLQRVVYCEPDFRGRIRSGESVSWQRRWRERIRSWRRCRVLPALGARLPYFAAPFSLFASAASKYSSAA